MPELSPVQISPSSESSPLKEGFKNPGLIPAAEGVQGDLEGEQSSANTSTPISERALASVTTWNEDTKASLEISSLSRENKVSLLFQSPPTYLISALQPSLY